MKYTFLSKISVIGLLILSAIGCQSQTTPDSSNKTTSNPPANNSNSANQTITEIPAPQTVKFVSKGNVGIVGTFYGSAKAGSPAVLLLHQWQSNRKSYDGFAKHLQAKGFGVLAIDGRGFGDSTKTTDNKTVAAQRTVAAVGEMIADVDNAFNFLATQKNVDAAKIGIVGASYGSSLAIIYAAKNKNVKATALLSPGINYFDNLPTEPAIKNYGDRPLLMVAAEDDKESADAVRKLKSEAADDKYETKIYDKGGHGTALFAVGLQDALEQFLTKNL